MGGHIIALSLVSLSAVAVYGRRNSISLEKKNMHFIIMAELICFFFIAFRATSVGLDTATYEFYFNLSEGNSTYLLALGWEPLYRLITTVARRFGTFRFVMVACALITCTGFGVFAYRMSVDLKQNAYWFFFFYITLNLYFNSMHLMRQMCAIAIVINIYPVLRRREKHKNLKCGLLLLAGLCFHILSVFAVAYFIPFFLTNDKKTIRRFILLTLLIIPLYGIGQQLLLRIPRLQRYAGDDRLSSGKAGVYSFIFILVKVVLVFAALKTNPKNPRNADLYRLSYIVIISTAFYVLQFFSQFALRIGYYFEVFMLFYIPEVLNHFSDKRTKRILYIIFFIFGLTYFFYMLSGVGGRGSNRGTVPYLLMWQ